MTSAPIISANVELLRIVERAAVPEERTDPSLFVPLEEQSAAVVSARLEAFVQAAADGDRGRFEQLLRARGLTLDELVRGLQDVRCGGALPDWAAALLEIMSDFAAAEAAFPGRPRRVLDDPPKPVVSVVRPLLGTAVELVRATCRELHVEIAEAAVWQVVRTLAHRLFGLSSDVLNVELRHAALSATILRQPAPQDLPSTHASWMQRFEQYPGLGRLVGTAYCNWRRHVRELLERLAADRPLLEERLFGGQPLRTLTAFGGDLGDVHDGGRAVALLTFDHGHSVLYKPKDLRSGAAFLDLLCHLNEKGLDPPLHVRTIVTRDRYAWDEFVPYAECRSREDVARFYRRMGMLVRVLQLLNARDFWLDNLIAAGDQPVFVDFEMILQPRMNEQPSLSPAERTARRQVDDSVVPIGAVAFCTPIADGVKAEDLGALTPVRDFLSPFHMSKAQSASFGIGAEAVRGEYMLWQKSDYAPSLDGIPQPAAEWLEEVVAGYRAMHGCLVRLRDTLPLDALAAFPVRYIHRDTWSCIKLIQSSVRADLLTDGFAREVFLHGLLQPAAKEPDDTGALRVAESEIRAFRQLDVPLFLCAPGSDAVFAPDGMHAKGYFPSRAADDLRQRVATLHELDPEAQVDLLRSCFATGAHVAREPRPLGPAGSIAPPRSEWWLAAAMAMGDRIAKQAIRGHNGEGAWVGLLYQPNLAIRSVDVLRPDILTGTCGLSIVFSDLFALTREPRFREAARMALVSTEAVARKAGAMFERTLAGRPGERRMPGCGACNGVGSQIYALEHAARRLELPRYGELARAYAATLPLDALCREARIDYISGTSGLVVALLALRDAAGPMIDAAVARIHEAMRRGFPREFPEYPEAETELAGLPSELDGHALALFRAGCETFARQGDHTGTLLTRIAIGDNVFDAVDRRLGQDAESSREALDAVEIALAAHRATGDGRYLCHAAANAAALAERGLTHSFAAEAHQLSALTGLGAVAHHFLRLYAPGRVGSIRLLELEGNS